VAKIVPKANVRGEVFEAAGALTAGTFVIKGTGGVVVQTAATQETYGVVSEDAVTGDLVTVWIGGTFEADVSGTPASGDALMFSTSVQVIAGTATNKQIGIASQDAAGGRIKFSLNSVVTGAVKTL
jgi:hypothetical protein